MEGPLLAAESVSADVSEFFQAELDAFVEWNRRARPTAWAQVERLQHACRTESPANAAGLAWSVRVLDERTGA
jgi:hypothetical protein